MAIFHIPGGIIFWMIKGFDDNLDLYISGARFGHALEVRILSTLFWLLVFGASSPIGYFFAEPEPPY
jgi:hypothetical protein